MKNILLPTDFSESAEKALNYALYLAKKTQATITLLNIAQPSPGSNTMHRNIRSILKNDSEKALVQLERKIRSNTANENIPIETVSRYGTLNVQIKAVVQDLEIDLIVMGTHGASGLKELILGSNTATIIEEITDCPVLAVPYKAPRQEINKIVFATTYSFNNIEILKELSALADTLGAAIQMLHVRTPKASTKEAVVEDFKQKLKAEIPQTNFAFHEIEHEDVVEGLQQYVIAEKIDLLAMGTRKKGFFGSFINKSLTKTAAFHTTIPLLAFHDRQKP